jgi:hypothetical protein
LIGSAAAGAGIHVIAKTVAKKIPASINPIFRLMSQTSLLVKKSFIPQ